MTDDEVVQPLKPVLRASTPEDDKTEQKNREKERQAYKTCQEKIQKHKLNMKLVEAEYTFDNNKLLFYFTADGRIDFRELVKDLASVFRTRIEYLNSRLPGVGDRVTTSDRLKGEVQSVNVLRQTVKVVVENGEEKEIREYPVAELRFKPRRKKENHHKVSKEEMKQLAALEDKDGKSKLNDKSR